MSLSDDLKKYLYVPSGHVTTEAVFGVMRQSGSQNYLSRVSSSSGAFSSGSYAGNHDAQETHNDGSSLNKIYLTNDYNSNKQALDSGMTINQIYSNSRSSSDSYNQGYISPALNQVVVSNAGDYSTSISRKINQGAVNNRSITFASVVPAANQNSSYEAKSYSTAAYDIPIRIELEGQQNYGSEFARNASSFARNGSSDKIEQIAQDVLRLSNVASLDTSSYSDLEAAIMNASQPFELPMSETIQVNDQSGMWINKNEVANWRGSIPISQYEINIDACPEIIRKATDQVLVYEQEVALRYLRPPTPPPPGEILIRQEKNIPTAPAPPLIIRQQPPRPETPAPLVFREVPPRPPIAVGTKVITISGKRLPPPPRKVVIERLAPLPSKPQSIIIERWLPYRGQKRRVIFQRNSEPDPIVVKPKNVIIQWESPKVTIKKEFKDLGVIRANPVEYVQRYGSQLRSAEQLPAFVKQIRPPTGVVFASDYQAPTTLELEGDLQALNYVDLDANGLSEYKYLLAKGSNLQTASQVSASALRNSSVGLNSVSQTAISGAYALDSGRSAEYRSSAQNFSANANNNLSFNTARSTANANLSSQERVIAELFASIDSNRSGRISFSEAERVLMVLNSRLGRNYGEDEALAFFRALDTNRDGTIEYDEFKAALFTFIEL